jgi:RNA polymerase sigma factor (sigma-70 family)
MAAMPNLAAAHDLDLVALTVSGTRAAYGELVRRHGSGVRSLLRRMGADPALADDLAQDAFLKAFEEIGEFRREGPFSAWVKRIAARLFIRRIRRDSRTLLTADPLDEDLAVQEISPQDRLDLDEALRLLSPPEKLCVSLCFGAGFSHPEAAEALSLPLGTVKSHVKRGMDKLRARLAPEQAGEGRAHG